MSNLSISTRAALAGALLALAVTGAGCSDGRDSSTDTTAPTSSTAPELERPYAVGQVQRTFVDTSRPTPAAEGREERPDRTIETTILYPASGTAGPELVANAAPAEVGAPFPLVILGHGLGGNVEYLTPLATEWAAAGYVVALPRFPLTHSGTPGGIDGADVQNQPDDIGVVIDEVLAASSGTEAPLARLVDPSRIGVAGHSNGGITTLGAAANSCCRDKRISAALVLAGTPAPFADGAYDFEDIPPIMFVHGVNDQAVAYNETVETFNEAATPKALLTLEKADHGEWLAPTNDAFPVVVSATTDFLDGYLRGDSEAMDRLGSASVPGVATMYFAPDEGAAVTVDTIPSPETNRQASVSADTDLVDGQAVTVTWSGFLPGKTVNVLQCVGDGRGGTASCGLSDGHVLVPDPTGAGSVELTVKTGEFANGMCDSQHPCTILINDSGLLDDDAFRYFPITFAS